MGLTKEHLQTDYAANKLAHPSEQALHDALDNVADRAQQAADDLDFATSLTELSSLKGPVDQLFEDVMVMDDDLEVRHNRLGLLRSVANAFRHIADFTRLST